MRATAASALLQFLLDYPLSPGRLQGHLLFLLTNTGYEHEEGRLQALEMLQQVRQCAWQCTRQCAWQLLYARLVQECPCTAGQLPAALHRMPCPSTAS